ncbi:2-amino-4-hydroxy-6-hydroxymethyldihydropteridine diphosphokinase [Acinetobacter silvestris]|uniref:2-amino-4-hydroxy-6-hydroxymethyldihydropteridine diphosphokinase n=1 Tax=Acinetobacter silvestris TaxID=1977882 RepID=A0A1Y3CG40_9GAMM|nr:2-amino-4-hydroxy-6-hydroxymethyldihydropteridine diphosphokinase [Acinetobacter silvestris]OTG66059.1 2-amino-4-hydroxy-6-hydroxymethyldihydropteridine pyrophosphokinase [Acinetobacter silvestris]
MNATETIFALALASNFHPKQNFETAIAQISALGEVIFSNIYLIPCRDGVGSDYWNSACLLKSHLAVNEMMTLLKQMEAASGRIRPSHHISLDVDLIAWGVDLSVMQFNPKKIPLALDVKIPMQDVWSDEKFSHAQHQFPIVSCDARTE